MHEMWKGIITLIFGIWCGSLRLQAFRLFYVFLIELPAKLVVIITVIIVYLKGLLHSLDFITLLMYYSFFFSSFSFVWDNFLLMLSVTVFFFLFILLLHSLMIFHCSYLFFLTLPPIPKLWHWLNKKVNEHMDVGFCCSIL